MGKQEQAKVLKRQARATIAEELTRRVATVQSLAQELGAAFDEHEAGTKASLEQFAAAVGSDVRAAEGRMAAHVNELAKRQLAYVDDEVRKVQRHVTLTREMVHAHRDEEVRVLKAGFLGRLRWILFGFPETSAE